MAYFKGLICSVLIVFVSSYGQAVQLPDDGKKLLITDDFGSISRCRTVSDIDRVAELMLSAQPDVMTIDFGSPDRVHFVSEAGTTHLSENMKALVEQGYDPYGHIVAQLQTGGIKVHGGLRMNDHHGQLRNWTQWHQDHIHWSLGEDTGDRTWRAIGALCQMDYAIEGVRQYRLNIIREALDRYPLDGIQLNFNRTAPFVSAPKRENGKYMTEFILGVRELLDNAAKKRNAQDPLQLGVIVPWDMEFCRNEGLEVERWITEELVDYIAPGEWHYTDYNIPFDQWTVLARGTQVDIYPKATGDIAPIRVPGWTFQSGSSPLLENSFNINGPMIAAFAELAYRQGADGMLLFNFYPYNFGALYPDVALWTNAENINNVTRHYYFVRKLKYLPTEQYTFSEGSAFDRFPLKKVGDTMKYEFTIGADLDESMGIFRFKMKDAYPKDRVRVLLNGREINPAHIERFIFTSRERILRPDDEYGVSIWQRPVDSRVFSSGRNTIEIQLIQVDPARLDKRNSLEICEFELFVH